PDAFGRRLEVTVAAVGDEIAGAADLMKGKTTGTPVAVVRGLGHLLTGAAHASGGAASVGARALQRPSDTDLFRLGTAEAYAEGFAAGQAARCET
ncbi:MAG: coenzyme F420-0:L-glutamate ligase, partial [Cryobacterium sp.]